MDESVDISLWLSSHVTKKLVSQAEQEVCSMNMTLVAGGIDFDKYNYLVGRIAGIRVVEDFIARLKSDWA